VAVGGTAGCLARWRAGRLAERAALADRAGHAGGQRRRRLCIGFSLVAFASAPSEGLAPAAGHRLPGRHDDVLAFTGESLSLLIKGQWGHRGVAHAAVHVFGALFAAALGWQIGRWVLN
jgi:hypothetical protein